MITKEFAEAFTAEWINAWNAHDIDRVLLKYRDDFWIETPRALEVVPTSGGKVFGKEAIRDYWRTSMKRRPDLHFKLLDLLVGIDSLSIYYLNTATNKRAVEMLCFDSNQKVTKVIVNYTL
ncbi:YybH family protein [Mucilaginibacter arboris]|uniref:Nuclear transport factor 2 family protein n=1 Tax=Mucilaginibacter arboris TaxID=2682090 RepID=A0A7K1STV5_9SPHI|nr:nuclear transport factor 2 family protein [Mucilaginibacter arboris]MVN20751.1 nuclear transport factor 2 family protein [Mucilaginibacter arboris]